MCKKLSNAFRYIYLCNLATLFSDKIVSLLLLLSFPELGGNRNEK